MSATEMTPAVNGKPIFGVPAWVREALGLPAETQAVTVRFSNRDFAKVYVEVVPEGASGDRARDAIRSTRKFHLVEVKANDPMRGGEGKAK